MSGYSRIFLPCGHRAAYRDCDPEEGVYLNHCDECDWRPGVENEFTKAEAARRAEFEVEDDVN